MRPSISIRPFGSQDWDAIAKVHDEARMCELALTVGLEAFRTLEQTAVEEGLFEGDLWVAEMTKTIVGFVVLSGDEVTWLYVSPAHSRQGIGRMLLRHVLARREGPIEVSVLDGNSPALELYESEGFRVVETRDGHLQGNEAIPARGHILRRHPL